ncbi:hypothetical protein VUR80DRAFT_2187 [Thermomyces stellatus]
MTSTAPYSRLPGIPSASANQRDTASMSSSQYDVCGCVASMMPVGCPDCGGHPRQAISCRTCGSKGVVFYPCQRCINGGGPVDSGAGSGAEASQRGVGR